MTNTRTGQGQSTYSIHPTYEIMVAPEDLECLKMIALQGGLNGPVFLNSQSLGSELGISPQTASRRLKALESQSLITRLIQAEGQQVTISAEGESLLRQEYCDYYKLFGGQNRMVTLPGVIESGLGEGAYYMSLQPYADQFVTILGFRPFPGTLNIRLSSGAVQRRKRLGLAGWQRVNGFQSEGRTFGEVKVLPCMIRDVPCGIVVPGRSHYPDEMIEVIAPVGLRKAFSLADGDEISVEITV